MRHASTLLVVLALVSVPAAAAAQGRDAQIRSAIAAYDNFETSRALRMLQTSLNPTLGPADSLWFRGAQFLVQMLFEEGQQDPATTWARWVSRLAPTTPVDTLLFISDVANAFRAARADIALEAGTENVVRTVWDWPTTAQAPTDPGRLRVIGGSGMATDIRVLVVGRGVFAPGQARSLPVGPYIVEASAEGYRTARLTREVLPGVLTELTFNLEPVAGAPVAAGDAMPNSVREAAANRFVWLTVDRFGLEPACAAGVMAGGEGLVLTTYGAIRGARNVSARLGTGQEFRANVAVVAHDVANDVAVLRLPGHRGDSLPPAAALAAGSTVWALGTDAACGAPTTTSRVVVEETAARLLLNDSIANSRGAILIDANAQLAGLPTGSGRAVSRAQFGTVLAAARRNASGAGRTIVALAEQERHAYGAVELSADVAGARATISPLETWHWPDLATTQALPFRYVGPMGRYRMEVSVNGIRRDQREFTIRPSVTDQLALRLQQQVAQTPQAPGQQPTRGGGGFPVPLAVGGGVAVAGAVVALLVLGGGDEPPPPTTGGITISIPNP
jgi:hypothetical protein